MILDFGRFVGFLEAAVRIEILSKSDTAGYLKVTKVTRGHPEAEKCRDMGLAANGRVISCGDCGLTVELQPDGAYKFDLSAWTSNCPHGGGGSPVLCPRFGTDLKMALIGEPPSVVQLGDQD